MNFNFSSSGRPKPRVADPLAHASLPSLRLLAGFLVCQSRLTTRGSPRDAADVVLAAVLPPGVPVCRALPALVGRARRSPAVRRAIDRWLDRELGPAAASYAALSPFELAGLWARERDRLRGRALAAFLWTLARRDDLPGRRLAARVAAGLESRDLWSEETLRV